MKKTLKFAWLLCLLVLALALMLTACGGSNGAETTDDAEITSGENSQPNNPGDQNNESYTLDVSSKTVTLSSENGMVQVLDVTSTYPIEIYYLIANDSVVSCAWSREWNDNVTQLSIYGIGEGTTYVYLYCSEDGTLNNAVASITLTVTVNMGWNPGDDNNDNGDNGNTEEDSVGSKGLSFYEYGNGYEVYRGSCADTDVVIPATYNGRPVVAIHNYAFAETSIKSIVIPNSVTKIGESAFWNCTKLLSITLPDSVSEIGDGAFSSCTKLASVNIPDGVTEIGSHVFANCESLTEILLPESVTEIGERAFSGCTALTAVNLPENLTKLGDYAFYECESLVTVKVGNRVKTIGESAFSSCRSLNTVIIPDSVQTIKDYAFYNCVRLTNVYLGSGLTDICYNAFYGCQNLSRAFYNGTASQWKKVINEGIFCDVFIGEQPVGEIVDIEGRMTKILVITGTYNGTMYLTAQFKEIANCETISEYRFTIDVYDTAGKIAYTYIYKIAADGSDVLSKLFALPHCANAKGYEVVISQIGIGYKDGSSEVAFTDYAKTISIGTELSNVDESKIVDPENSTRYN